MSDEYITVRIPESLRDLVEKKNEEIGLGYTSFAEFVKEAIRKRLEDLIATYREKDT